MQREDVMKRTFLVGVVAAAILVSSTASFAASEDFSFGVGLKGWNNTFKLKFTDQTTGASFAGDSNSSALMLGPTAKLSYKQLIMGATYLATVSDYENKDATGIVSDKMSRNDIDIIAGYMFIPQFGVVGGYKAITMEKKFEDGVTPDRKYSLDGWALGLTSSVPLPFEAVRMAIYGNAAYLLMKQTIDFGDNTPDRKDDFTGYSAELGLACNIVAGLSAQVGYKWQQLESKKNDDYSNKITENFKGVSFGADYRF
jgi:opacity protein-like surface antigen